MILSYVSRGYMYMYTWLIIYIQCAKYTHSNLVYSKHNGDDEPYE